MSKIERISIVRRYWQHERISNSAAVAILDSLRWRLVADNVSASSTICIKTRNFYLNGLTGSQKLSIMHHKLCVLLTTLLASLVTAAPAPSVTSSALTSTPTVPFASDDPNNPLWNPESAIIPEPIRGSLGATILGPQNIPMELQNSDAFAPPTTDNGNVWVPSSR
jgi:hypothetical protein